MQTDADKQHVLELLDRLSAGQLSAVVHLLEAMSDPAETAAGARLDDEPVSAEDARRVREGREWFAKRGGKGIPMDEVLADFGLKAGDFPTAG
jgi:hypothetical protein